MDSAPPAKGRVDPAVLRRRIEQITLVAALYGLLVWLVAGLPGGVEETYLLNTIDIRVYLAAAQTLLTDAPLIEEPVLGPLYFVYPPFAALLFFPLTLLGEGVGKSVWTLLTACLTYLVMKALVREVPAAAKVFSPRSVLQISIFALFALAPTLDTLALGQINTLLMLLVVLDLVHLKLGQKGKWWSGALIGIATGIKLTPGLFIVYLLWLRRWREAGIAVITFLVTAVIGFLVMPRDSIAFWTEAMLETNRMGPPDQPANQSFMGLLTRVSDGEPTQLVWLAVSCLVCGLAILAGGLAYRRGRAAFGGLLVGVASCVASPWSWGHHWVWVPALIVVLLADAAVRLADPDAFPDRWPFPLLGAIGLTLVFTLWPARWQLGSRPEPLIALHYNAHGASIFSGLYTLAGIGLILWFFCYEVWLWRRLRRARTPQPEEPVAVEAS